MSGITEDAAERLVDELADKSSPDKLDKLDRQFADKLARLEASDKAPGDMAERLRLFWRMLKAPDERVPWKSKTLLMAALMYFASPFDMIPDFAGKLGYVDDALIIKIVHRRLKDEIEKFEGA